MLQRLAFVVASLWCAVAVQAQQAPYLEGKHYFRIATAQPTSTPGKVEVVEVFSYGCGACARFQPVIDQWAKKAPAQAQFSYMPADFNPGWVLLARAFYAAEALGLHSRSHQAIFDNNFVQNKPLRNADEVIALLGTFGKSTDEVTKAMNSVGVEARMAQAHKRAIAYGIDSTPTLVVNGKWRVNGDGVSSYEEMIAVLNYLIAMEAASLPTPTAAPKG